MGFVGRRARVKNYVYASQVKHGVARRSGHLFGIRGWVLLTNRLNGLPLETTHATERLAEKLDHLDEQVKESEERMGERTSPEGGARGATPSVEVIFDVVM